MTDTPLFANRIQAGERLAEAIDAKLHQLADGVKPRPIVYALPRGGLPVAAPIADLLGCPLTVTVAKKISHPSNSELAIGAVAASGQALWMQQKFIQFRPNSRWRKVALEAALSKARFLEAQFLPFCPQVDAKGATLILVDDGIATGMTIAIAAKALSMLAPAQIWLCAPLAPPRLLAWLQQWCNSNLRYSRQQYIKHRIIILATPELFVSVSNFYAEFPQVEISEALMFLHESGKE